MTSINTTEIIEALDQPDGKITYELGAPHTNLKGNFISLRSPAIKEPIQLPQELFDELVRQGLIEKVGPIKDGSMTYNLTRKGQEIARA